MERFEHHFLKKGHLSDHAAALYVDALVQEDQTILPEEVLVHVEACLDCKDRILDLSLFLRGAGTRAQASPGPKLVELPTRQERYFYPARAAAVFFILALLLGIYFLVLKDNSVLDRYLTGHPDNSQQVQTQPTHQGAPAVTKSKEEVPVPAAGGENGLPGKTRVGLPRANYRVNPNLENWIGSQSRSLAVQVLSPQNNAWLEKDILFSWQEVPISPLHLKILNNRNEVLFEYSLRGNRFDFKERLHAGLYYWKLESASDLLYVGKFFIK